MTKQSYDGKPDSDRPALEITDAMIEAGAEALAEAAGLHLNDRVPDRVLRNMASDTFRAMLAAS